MHHMQNGNVLSNRLVSSLINQSLAAPCFRMAAPESEPIRLTHVKKVKNETDVSSFSEVTKIDLEAHNFAMSTNPASLPANLSVDSNSTVASLVA